MSGPQRDTIAIVDDDTAVRDSLSLLLEVVGYMVEAFASAAEFLQAKQDKIGCLILDHHMPGMTGLELAARLRTDGNEIPIMLITGSPSPAMIARAAELRVDRVVEKPPEEGPLLEFLERAMSR